MDEVQRQPELFPLICSLVDEWNRPGCFLILGSASRDLLKQSSESLAGRISYKRLTPFLWEELENDYPLEQYFSSERFIFQCGIFSITEQRMEQRWIL